MRRAKLKLARQSTAIDFQRVYYYTSAKHGLSNVRNRRVKISDILSLNDPFEFLGLNVQDQELRHALQRARETMAERSGLICFSETWKSPLMWSHYADRHRGICLGFDISAENVCKVIYRKQRPRIASQSILDDRVSDRSALNLVACKAHYWAYEREVRAFCRIDNRDENGVAFREFDDTLVLRDVIVGPNSSVTREQVESALGEDNKSVASFKARIAFGSFRVVRNRREDLWQ